MYKATDYPDYYLIKALSYTALVRFDDSSEAIIEPSNNNLGTFNKILGLLFPHG